MRKDPKTLINSAVSIVVGFWFFEVGLAWSLLGQWNGRAFINNTAERFGQFLVYWLCGFAVIFVAAIIFIAKPSRALARQVLVASAALVALPFFAVGLLTFFQSTELASLPSTPTLIVLFGGVYLLGFGVFGAVNGFPGYGEETSPTPESGT